jgi:hypothetical protein
MPASTPVNAIQKVAVLATYVAMEHAMPENVARMLIVLTFRPCHTATPASTPVNAIQKVAVLATYVAMEYAMPENVAQTRIVPIRRIRSATLAMELA